MSRATSTVSAPNDPSTAPTRLTIVYDETCGVCRRARDWLLTQPCLVPVELLPAGSAEARSRYGGLPWLGEQLVAVDENGNAWIGPAAYLAGMWATARYRSWAFRLSRPSLSPYAERFFYWFSRRRDRWSAWISQEDAECSWCDDAGPARPPRQEGMVAWCDSGHPMKEGQRYCVVCGLPRAGARIQ